MSEELLQRKPSLRTRLVRHVMLPLVMTWMLSTVVAMGIANYFTQQAFDRFLLDDAYAVATNTKLHDGALELSLSSREIGNILFDQSESVFFAVLRPDGTLIAGHGGLRPAPLAKERTYQFADVNYQGRPLRSVTLHRQEPAEFDVVMAQTTRSQAKLLQRLLLYFFVPQAFLLLLLAIWLRRAIQADLVPLGHLQQGLNERDARDLTPVEVSSNTRDVEELAAAVNALLERIGHSVRAQREFAGNVAHELRTPLAGIRAVSEYGLLQKDPQLMRQQLEVIAKSEVRASHLVDQLLALALADEADASFSLEPVALHELVRSAVLRYLPRADAAGIDLGAEGLDEPVQVRAHPALIDGILNNLLDNAFRYGVPKDGSTPVVTVALQQDGSQVNLSVTDNGPGIPTERKQQLLQRWARGVDGERLGLGAGLGAGLGLAIVNQYARILGAQLLLESGTPAGGLRVTVILKAV
jgi:two-component system sensor histidine kinase TctE